METGKQAEKKPGRQERRQEIRRETEAGREAQLQPALGGGAADCYLHLCSMRHFPNCLQEGIVNTEGFIFV